MQREQDGPGKGLAIVGEKGRELIFGKDGVTDVTRTASLVNWVTAGNGFIPNKETKCC